MQNITRAFIATLLLFTVTVSFAQLPFTAENMENFSGMNQADFIKAMNDYPGFKENVAHRTVYNCEFDPTDSAGSGVFTHFILVHEKDPKNGRITVTMSTFLISKYVDPFALSLINNGYTETTDSIATVNGLRSFIKKPYAFFLPTPQKGHKGIILTNSTPSVAAAQCDIFKGIRELDIDQVQTCIDGGVNLNTAFAKGNFPLYPLGYAVTAYAQYDDKGFFETPAKTDKLFDIIKLIADHTIDLDKKSGMDKEPPINIACNSLRPTPAESAFYGRVVELLLSKGANPNIINHLGSTCLIDCVSRLQVDRVKALLAHGADKNIVYHIGKLSGTALSEAKEVMHLQKSKEGKENAKAISELLEK